MKQLPNNCRIGNISVHPKNWNSKKLNPEIINSGWYIKYRFYDDNTKQSKQIVIKGMNEYKTLKEKQDAVNELITLEMANLENGLNKITKRYHLRAHCDISEYTPLCKALEFAFQKIDMEGTTKIDMKSCLKYFSESADQLNFSGTPLKEVQKNISD